MNIIINKLKNKRVPLIYFLILATYFALPFERIPTFELAGYTIKFSFIIGLSVLILFLTTRIKKMNLATKRISSSDVFLFLFWVTGLISLVFSPDTKRGITILFLWGFVFSLYWVFSRLTVAGKIAKIIETVLLTVTVLVCLFGVYQFIGDSLGLSTKYTFLRIYYTKEVEILQFPRIQSTGLEPLYFSNFLIIPLFLSFKKYLNEKKYFNKYFFINLLILINIILGISRGAYIAITFSFILLVIYLIFILNKKQALIKISGMLLSLTIAIVVSLSGIYILNGPKALSNYSDHAVVEKTQDDGSAFDRIAAYKIAFSYFKEKPVLGWGPGSFGSLATSDSQKEKREYNIVNNQYLEILVETGVIGFIFFFLFLFSLAKEVWSKYKVLDVDNKISLAILFLGCVAIFVQYNFFSTLYIIYIWLFLALLRGESYSEKTV